MRRLCGWIGLGAIALLLVSYLVAAFTPPVQLLSPMTLFWLQPDQRRVPSEPLPPPGISPWGAPAWDTQDLRYPYGPVPPYAPSDEDRPAPVPEFP